jgi:2,4-dienoyl-CoA reductase-like NADH-dependent reductase (Old Yellow Enzyme family)
MSDSLLFTPLALGCVTLPNRIIRSATYEGLGDAEGMPQPELADRYIDLRRGGAGALITGFVFVSRSGRAMQPGQCGIESDGQRAAWERIVKRVRAAPGSAPLFMQLAHAGRQTLRSVTGGAVRGASSRRCTYFREAVTPYEGAEIPGVVREFTAAARRAREAGFEGVQIHAAHGYLIHQFLSPWTNTRRDRWGDRPLFLEAVVEGVRRECGPDFPILVKLSVDEARSPGIRVPDTLATVRRLEQAGVAAVEISTGTMERALDIMRGDCPAELALRVNPLFTRLSPVWLALWKRFFLKRYVRRFIPFAENYNVPAAAAIKASVRLPVFAVGGIRTRAGMEACLAGGGLDAVALCRPLLCEPDLPLKMQSGAQDRSACTNCNLCTIYCDAPRPVRCWRQKKG